MAITNRERVGKAMDLLKEGLGPFVGRVGRDASRIAEEIIAHLVGLAGSEVTVTLDIEARLRDGASEHVLRTVTENGRELRFDAGSGFEQD